MAKPYIKLDMDWREDPKVMLFEERYGKAALVDWVALMCLMGEFGGSFCLDDEATQLRVQKVLRKKAKATEQFLEKCADCGLIDEVGLYTFRRVGSARSIKDGEARAKRREYAIAASEAAREKRLEDQGEDGN